MMPLDKLSPDMDPALDALSTLEIQANAFRYAATRHPRVEAVPLPPPCTRSLGPARPESADSRCFLADLT